MLLKSLWYVNIFNDKCIHLLLKFFREDEIISIKIIFKKKAFHNVCEIAIFCGKWILEWDMSPFVTEVFLERMEPLNRLDKNYFQENVFHNVFGITIFNDEGFLDHFILIMNRLIKIIFKKKVFHNVFKITIFNDKGIHEWFRSPFCHWNF